MPQCKMDNLKRLLNQECDRTLSDEEWDALFALAEEISLKKGEVLITPGEVNPDVYIVKEGILRGVDFDGDQGARSVSACQTDSPDGGVAHIEACQESV